MLSDAARNLGGACEATFAAWFDEAPLTQLLRELEHISGGRAASALPYVDDALDVAFIVGLVADRAEEVGTQGDALSAAVEQVLQEIGTGNRGRLAQLGAYRIRAAMSVISPRRLARDLVADAGGAALAEPDILRLLARILP